MTLLAGLQPREYNLFLMFYAVDEWIMIMSQT